MPFPALVPSPPMTYLHQRRGRTANRGAADREGHPEGASAMRLVVTGILISVLLVLSGCGHVAGNYPVPKKRPPQLPETYEIQGESKPVVWERPGEVRIFALDWRNLKESIPMLRAAVNAGQRQAEPYLRFIEPLAEKNLVLYSVAAFLHKDASLQIPPGRIEISFADGTSATDQGTFFIERKNDQVRFRDSRNKVLKVESKYASEPGKPVVLSFILPEEDLGKKVTSVRYARD
jgi:hypothetical protein